MSTSEILLQVVLPITVVGVVALLGVRHAKRIMERAEPRPRHDWEDLGVVQEDGIPAQWARRDIRCRCCGEERRVFSGLDLDTIVDRCDGARV